VQVDLAQVGQLEVRELVFDQLLDVDHLAVPEVDSEFISLLDCDLKLCIVLYVITSIM
jgi:hypothetical protein